MNDQCPRTNDQGMSTVPFPIPSGTARRRAIRVVIWCLVLPWTLVLGHWSFAPTAVGAPNILFLFADDQCYETIRALGHTDIDTPNLDRLTRRGTTFTHAYNMGSWSGAVCVASRTMLITGRSVWDAHAIYNESAQELAAGRFWPVYMKNAGYQTYFTGKWHIRADAEKAFDVARHVRPGMPKTVQESYDRPHIGQPDPWSPYDQSLGGFWEGGTHWSEVVANDAIDYLNIAKGGDKPFFMYIAFNAPHDPRQAPKEYVDRYPLDRIQLPASYLPEYPHKEEIGAGRKLRDEALAPFPRTGHAVKVHRQEYYAIITHMDAQIGRILDALEQSGQADNTWIFFSADHGLAVGHHGLFGKQNMYDHSVRVPFIVAGPGVPKNKRIAAPIYLQDVMATSLDLAGVKKPEHVWFNSLLPLIQGRAKQSAYDAIYGAYLELQRSITVDGMKLIVYPKARVVRLYDLKKDPQELKDLAGDPKQQPVIDQLFIRLLAQQKELGDQLDLLADLPSQR
jgi:arylsulfatase A-like enzyme